MNYRHGSISIIRDLLQISLKVVIAHVHRSSNCDSVKVVQEAPMNRTTSIRVWHVLLPSIAAFLLAGCGVLAVTATPIPQPPTAVPPYIHYIPSEGFNIHLEFDYPGSWTFSEDKIQGTDFIEIGLGDPRFRTLPTPLPDDFHPRPNDFGRVVIWIVPGKPGQTPDTEVESRKQGYDEEHRYTLLKDYKITIDRHDASVLEYQIKPFPESYPSLMFARRIFFVVEDQMYEIYFSVAEKDRGGEFEQGYEYFFNSLKIVP